MVDNQNVWMLIIPAADTSRSKYSLGKLAVGMDAGYFAVMGRLYLWLSADPLSDVLT